MSELIISLLFVSFIGHQIDESKIKKYEMIDSNGKVVKVQFSENGEYSCPMSCGLEHFHYAKKTDQNIEHVWSIESMKEDDKEKIHEFNVNGSDIVSYQVINAKQKPKRLPLISIADQKSVSERE